MSNSCEQSVESNSLVCNSLKRGIIVEAKVTGVNDMVSTGLLGQLIQGFQISCARRMSVPDLQLCCLQPKL